MATAVMTSNCAACVQSLQSTARAVGLSRALTIMMAANRIISPAISFGIIPAPGAESAAERQVAADGEYQKAEGDESAPGHMVGADDHFTSPRSSLDFADLADGILDALGVGVPEGLEFGLHPDRRHPGRDCAWLA